MKLPWGLRPWHAAVIFAVMFAAVALLATPAFVRRRQTKPKPTGPCLMTYKGVTYDLRTFINEDDHPGGDLSDMCGTTVAPPATHDDGRMDDYVLKAKAPAVVLKNPAVTTVATTPSATPVVTTPPPTKTPATRATP